MGDAKVMLRTATTGRWYAGPDQWVDDFSVAREFGTVAEAFDCGEGLEGSREAEVVLHYEVPLCDLVLPLNGRAGVR